MARSRRWGDRFGVAAVVIPLLVWLPSVLNDFVVSDDQSLIVRNPLMNPPSWPNVGFYLTHPAMHMYQPLTTTLWSALAWLAWTDHPSRFSVNLNASVFHLASVLLQVIATGLVFQILRVALNNRWAALLGALVFAVHPLQTEVVAYAGVMNQPLAGMLSLLAVSQYLTATNPLCATRLRRRAWIVGSIALLLAMFAKPMAVVVPPIAMTLDMAVHRRGFKRCLIAMLPWVAMTIPFALLVRSMQHAAEMAIVPMNYRVVVAGDAVLFYIRKLLWPVSMCLDYGRTPYYLVNQRIGWGRPLMVVVLLSAFVMAARRTPLLLAAAAVMLLGVLPNLGLIPFDYQTWSTVSDRYFYLSMLGVGLSVGIAAQKLPWSRYAFLAAIGLCIVLTEKQITTWHDGETMARHNLAVNPNSWMAANNLAVMLATKSPDEALTLCRHALAARPESGDIWNTLGSLLMARGDHEAGANAYHEALRHDPANPVFSANFKRASQDTTVVK